MGCSGSLDDRASNSDKRQSWFKPQVSSVFPFTVVVVATTVSRHANIVVCDIIRIIYNEQLDAIPSLAEHAYRHIIYHICPGTIFVFRSKLNWVRITACPCTSGSPVTFNGNLAL